MDIAALVERAYNRARGAEEEVAKPGALHHGRSQRFVRLLAEELRDAYTDRDRVIVLTRGENTHRAAIGSNELLHDITVCEVSTTKSARGKSDLTCVERALWQVESEFERNTREAVYDFNKLVLGSAENKLFIGPRKSDQRAYLGALAHCAANCTGSVFISLVPHPSSWASHPIPLVHSFCWEGEGWTSSLPPQDRPPA